MVDEKAFHISICAEPENVSLRLVFADALEEWGECERSEFIRLQIHMANCRMCHRKDGSARKDGYTANCGRCVPGRKREVALLAATTPEPCKRCGGSGGGLEPILSCRNCVDGVVQVSNACRWAEKLGGRETTQITDRYWHVCWSNGTQEGNVFGRFINGFIGCVSLSCQALMGDECPNTHATRDGWPHNLQDGSIVSGCELCHGSGYVGGVAADLARFPLTSVELSDKRPYVPITRREVKRPFGFYDEADASDNQPVDPQSDLPTALLNLLEGNNDPSAPIRSRWYASAASAQAALSRAALAFVMSLRKQEATV